MLINTLANALPTPTALSNEAVTSLAVPSNAMLAAAVKASAARPLAVSGPGAVVCAGAWIGGGYPAGAAGGVGKATGGYAQGFVGSAQPQKARFDATNGSNVQSTVQHNTMTRLIPVLPGGVGPHPAREPKPA
jgi:hypothetical protein